MNNLFDQTEKLVKFHRNVSQQLKIQRILHPLTQTFIEEEQARKLGIIFHGYYRNRYGGYIPLHIAASQGFIQFTINDQIECEEFSIEYRSSQSSLISHLTIDQVYDPIKQRMIPYRQAIDEDLLDLERFSYSSGHLFMPIHEAFYRGFLLGQLRTNTMTNDSNTRLSLDEKCVDDDDDYIVSSLTNMINSLCEFRNTIHIDPDYQLSTDGFIQEKSTGKSYLLSQAIELNLISIEDRSIESTKDVQCTLINESEVCQMEVDENNADLYKPLFSETFLWDILKYQQDVSPQLKYHLPLMNSC